MVIYFIYVAGGDMLCYRWLGEEGKRFLKLAP
jgi:hypothetical protein